MSTDIQAVPAVAPEITALIETCQTLAEQSALDKFEIAVKSRIEQGINDDNDLRITDELLHQVVLGGDALDHSQPRCDPRISSVIAELHSRHKAAIELVKPWRRRWTVMVDLLSAAILKYKRAKEELVRRQNEELAKAAEEKRRREEAQAREALRNGDMTGAQQAIERAAQVVTPVISQATPTLDYSTGRKVWEVEITDRDAFIKAIAAGVVSTSVIKEFDLVFLKKEAARRGGLDWPGVKAWQEDALSKRRR